MLSSAVPRYATPRHCTQQQGRRGRAAGVPASLTLTGFPVCCRPRWVPDVRGPSFSSSPTKQAAPPESARRPRALTPSVSVGRAVGQEKGEWAAIVWGREGTLLWSTFPQIPLWPPGGLWASYTDPSACSKRPGGSLAESACHRFFSSTESERS